MPYIPQFNKLSLQEISYAPMLMRQQHDEEIAKQMELAEALKFDYLKQDAAGLEPILQGYNSDIETLSKEIAQNGFSHDVKNKVLGLRQKYVADDKIRTYKKNYADAMSQWGDVRKKMLQEGRSGDEINNQKAAFFSGYAGAYSPTGEKNEFTPGRTSGYYNPLEDVSKLMKGLGENGKLVGLTGSSANIVYKTDPYTGQRVAGIEFRDSRSGQLLENSKEISDMLSAVAGQYADSRTDRGLWANINKQDQESLLKTITDVANAHLSSKYTHIPETSNRWNPLDNVSGKKSESDGSPFLTYPGSSSDADITDDANDAVSVLDTPLPTTLTEGEKAAIAEMASRGGAVPNADYIKSQHQKKLQEKQTELAAKKQQTINSYKKNYPGYFTDPNVDPVVATKRAIATQKNNAATINQITGINVDDKEYSNTGLTENILNKVIGSGDVPLFEKQDKDKHWYSSDTYKKKDDYIKLYEDSKLDWKTQMPFVDNNGNIYVKDPADKLLKVNPNAFDQNTQDLQSQVLKPVLKQLTDPALFDGNNNVPVRVPNTNIYFDVELAPGDPDRGIVSDPYNVSDRIVHMYSIDPKTEKVNGHMELTPAQAKQEIVRGIFQGFKNTTLQ